MAVVAEGLVRGGTAAAQARARQDLERPVVMPHLDTASYEQRAIAHRRHARRLRFAFLRSAIRAAVLQCAAGASLDDHRDVIRWCRVGRDPRTAFEIEHPG